MHTIVGTWQLVATTAVDAAGNPMPTPYGPKAMGRVTFNADGRMMAVLCDGRPELPDGEPRDYASYCGNYRFDGSRLLHGSTRPRIPRGWAPTRCARFASRASA